MAWVTADDRRLIAKWSSLPQLFAHLADAASVAMWLDTQGIPVAAPIPATDDRLLVELGDDADGALLPPGRRFLVGVLPVVEGDLLDVDDVSHVADAGQMMARVHEGLASYRDGVDRRRPRGLVQLVDNDFRSANILHDGSRITAVLDLEELTYDTRVADLAKSAVLLGTRYRDWRPTSEGVRRTYVAACNDHARDPLTTAEQGELDGRIAAVLKTKGWT
ncbi:MAG: phosphotransferase [Acidimicrobiia bacterium]|nr:phosphotransferase [Acidimicrobiia bacterium]